MDTTQNGAPAGAPEATTADEPAIIEEIEVEDLAVDGICGVY